MPVRVRNGGVGNPLPPEKQTLPAPWGLDNGTFAQGGGCFWEPRAAGPSPGRSSQPIRDADGVVLVRMNTGTRAGGSHSDQQGPGRGWKGEGELRMSGGESMGTKGWRKRPRNGEVVGRGDSVGPAGESMGKEGADGLMGSRCLSGLKGGRRSP